jgi:hypothetical protein
MNRTLRPRSGGRSYCSKQVAPKGYDLEHRQKLSDYFPKEQIKEKYTLEEFYYSK